MATTTTESISSNEVNLTTITEATSSTTSSSSSSSSSSSALTSKSLLLQEMNWSGRVPIRFECAAKDVAVRQQPDAYHTLPSRMAYLWFAAAETVEYFRTFTTDVKPEIWFEAAGVPLKINIPIGALYDLFHHSIPSSSSSSSTAQETSTTTPSTTAATTTLFSERAVEPWVITIHFQRFPNDRILRYENNIEYCRSQYFHSFKQALHLTLGSTNAFNTLTIENQNDLFHSANHGNVTTFQSNSQSLLFQRESLRSVPVRFIVYTAATQTITCLQKPVAVFLNKEEKRETTVQDVLRLFFPQQQQQQQQQSTDSTATPAALVVVVGQGVVLPPQAPIYDIWRELCHGDYFLYLTLLHQQRH